MSKKKNPSSATEATPANSPCRTCGGTGMARVRYSSLDYEQKEQCPTCGGHPFPVSPEYKYRVKVNIPVMVRGKWDKPKYEWLYEKKDIVTGYPIGRGKIQTTCASRVDGADRQILNSGDVERIK